jgi:galactose mutarotase-like enzyme
LLLKQPSDSINTNVMPDGGEAQATFRAGNFDGHWPSQTEVMTTVALSGKSMTMRIVARNTGNTVEPMGIGWHPRFAILGGHRAQMLLRLPEGLRVEVKDRRSGELSGRLVPVEKTEYDFTSRTGAQLGALKLDDSFVHLRTGLMENGPMAELRDPENDYGLRITARLRPSKQYGCTRRWMGRISRLSRSRIIATHLDTNGQETKIPGWWCCSRDNRCSGRFDCRYFH